FRQVFYFRRRDCTKTNRAGGRRNSDRRVRLLLLPQSRPRDVLAIEHERESDLADSALARADNLAHHRHLFLRRLSATDFKRVKTLTTDYTDITNKRQNSFSESAKSV